jgi:hypothetical protein
MKLASRRAGIALGFGLLLGAGVATFIDSPSAAPAPKPDFVSATSYSALLSTMPPTWQVVFRGAPRP